MLVASLLLAAAPPAWGKGGSVSVRGHYRAGHWVKPYTRSAPHSSGHVSGGGYVGPGIGFPPVERPAPTHPTTPRQLPRTEARTSAPAADPPIEQLRPTHQVSPVDGPTAAFASTSTALDLYTAAKAKGNKTAIDSMIDRDLVYLVDGPTPVAMDQRNTRISYVRPLDGPLAGKVSAVLTATIEPYVPDPEPPPAPATSSTAPPPVVPPPASPVTPDAAPAPPAPPPPTPALSLVETPPPPQVPAPAPLVRTSYRTGARSLPEAAVPAVDTPSTATTPPSGDGWFAWAAKRMCCCGTVVILILLGLAGLGSYVNGTS